MPAPACSAPRVLAHLAPARRVLSREGMAKVIPLFDRDDEATVITRAFVPPAPPDAAPPLDPDATVISHAVVADAVPATVAAEDTARTRAAPAAPSHAAIAHLFAEPPQLPPKPVEPAAPPRRWNRRRRLLLVAVTAVGAWLTLGHRRGRPGPSSAVLAIRPAAIAAPPAPRVPVGAAELAPAPLRPTDAVDSVVTGRAPEALQRYLRLSADRPDDPVYRAAAEILIDQLDDRCRTERSLACTAAPSLR